MSVWSYPLPGASSGYCQHCDARYEGRSRQPATVRAWARRHAASHPEHRAVVATEATRIYVDTGTTMDRAE